LLQFSPRLRRLRRIVRAKLGQPHEQQRLRVVRIVADRRLQSLGCERVLASLVQLLSTLQRALLFTALDVLKRGSLGGRIRWRRLFLASFYLAAPALAAEQASIDRLMASTVCVVGEVPGGSFESSGFVVPPGDTVMTTAHAIGAANNLRIKLRDGRVFPARLERLGNENADIALLGVAA